MTTTGSNPSTSPRLPSPPPFTEVQIPPAPLSLGGGGGGGGGSGESPKPPPPAATAATRRIRPGTKSVNITTGPPLTSLSDLDSAFQLQEHLSALLSSTISPPDSHSTHPLTRDDAARLATPPEGVEDSLWCYELTRRLTRDLNVLIVSLLNDSCSAATCPEMRASEWQYLCAVHESPQSCCAIDYSTHTLDQAATMLTSTKFFPSRLSLAQQSTKHLASIFRRLYRIFAHAWFQHRHCFWEVESELGLYVFFKTVSERYNLIPEDNLTLPAEAEGLPERRASDEDMEEEEEEEPFSEWNRNTRGGPKGELLGVFRVGSDEEDEEEEDDDDDDAYSDESESDEELMIEVEEEDLEVGEKLSPMSNSPPEELPPLEEELGKLEIVEEKPDEEVEKEEESAPDDKAEDTAEEITMVKHDIEQKPEDKKEESSPADKED